MRHEQIIKSQALSTKVEDSALLNGDAFGEGESDSWGCRLGG